MNIGVPSDFTEQQADIYTRLIRHMTHNKAMYCHPDAPIVEDEHWATTAANAAYVAAFFLEDDAPMLQICDADTGDVLSIEGPQSLQ